MTKAIDPASLPLVVAGVPAKNLTLYHRIRFAVGDPAALLEERTGSRTRRTLLVRDIESSKRAAAMPESTILRRANFRAKAASPESGDRDRQAFAELFAIRGIAAVRVKNRRLPLVFSEHLRRAGIAIEYDPRPASRNVVQRTKTRSRPFARRSRRPSRRWSGRAGSSHAPRRPPTDRCFTKARRSPRSGCGSSSTLRCSNRASTIPRASWRAAYGAAAATSTATARCGPAGVIVDIFPRSKATLYNGDCTRTVVRRVPDVRPHARGGHRYQAREDDRRHPRRRHRRRTCILATLSEIHRLTGFEAGTMPPTDDPPNAPRESA